ncbi:hypothetical protein N7454_005773 [Penicillium verhagenii]|nr:hypothetical protein N7454_005773 [Penicillium verhagenii]
MPANRMLLPDLESVRDIADSTLMKSLHKSTVYAQAFWATRKPWTADYVPDYSRAPAGFDPAKPGTGTPDTSSWPVFDGHTRGGPGSWPPPAGVVLGSSLADGSVRPTCPPFGPAPVINSNCLTFAVIYQRYYCFAPESVVFSTGYLLSRKVNAEITGTTAFSFGQITLGGSFIADYHPIQRQALDFSGTFADSIDEDSRGRLRGRFCYDSYPGCLRVLYHTAFLQAPTRISPLYQDAARVKISRAQIPN